MRKKTALPMLFFTLLLDVVGIGMIIPIIPIIFTDPTSPSFMLFAYTHQMQLILAGAVAAITGLMTFIAAPIMGELSDIYGRKKLLLLGVSIMAISQVVFGIGILTSSLTVLFISRIINGLAGGNISIVQASIADISEPHERAKNFGLIGAAFGMGFIIGPVLGGYLAHLTGNPSVPFFFAGFLGLINTLSVYFLLEETKRDVNKTVHSITMLKAVRNLRSAFTDKEVSYLYSTSFFYVAGFTFFTSFTGIYLVHKFALSEAALGSYFGAIGIWIVITQGFILRVITKYYNERQILRVAMPIVALSITSMTFVPSMLYAYALLPLIAIPQGLSMASIGALISKSVGKDKQGAALGINGSLSALNQGLIPAIAGVLTAYTAVWIPFIFAGASIITAWRVLQKHSHKLIQ
jgi:DHA1 family tetracycline resistance protein-like MFS transporter